MVAGFSNTGVVMFAERQHKLSKLCILFNGKKSRFKIIFLTSYIIVSYAQFALICPNKTLADVQTRG